MFRGMAAAMAEKGYVGTPVAEIIRRAGVSRETFYQQFASKQECFAAAYDWVIDDLRDSFIGGLEGTGSTHRRFATLLDAYLQALAEDSARARLFMVEVYAAGPDLMRRRLTAHQELVAGLTDLFSAHSPEEHFACEALLAATINMVTTHLVLGEPDRIPALHQPLADLATRLFPDA